MPHYPKPFFRKGRGLWYVQLAGKQINLGPDRDAAFARYHGLMAEAPSAELPPSVDGSPLVTVLADQFLDWVKTRRAAATYDWYGYHLQSFVSVYPAITVRELRPYHVENWANAKEGISATSRTNFLRAVKRCLTWATKQGYIDSNPIGGLEVPTGERREDYLSPEGFAELVGFVRDRSLADLMTVTYETGCRPQESLRVEASHVDLDHSRWVLPISKSKGKSMPRVVYLSDLAREITQRLMLANPSGPLFRNSRGIPWTKDSVNCAFERLHVRMGKVRMLEEGVVVEEEAVAELASALNPKRRTRGRMVTKTDGELRTEARVKLTGKLAKAYAKKCNLYTLRHSWATNALERGVDSLTVAVLMGHKDPSQLAKTYQHLSHNPGHLLEQARRASA